MEDNKDMRNNHIPKVSIGMPVYNGERFIRKALDSLLAQTFTDFELIISDNASVDGTEGICRQYVDKDSRVRYIRQPKNMGAMWNFNYVLQQAKGDYFMWAAADDMWDSSWIEILLSNAAINVTISFGHLVNINENDKIIRRYPKFNCFRENKFIRLIKYYLLDGYYGKANFVYGLYRRLYLINKGGFKIYNNCNDGQDMHFIFDVLIDGNFNVDHKTYLYKRVITEDSKRNNTSENIVKKYYKLLLSPNNIRHLISFFYIPSDRTIKILLFIFFIPKLFNTYLIHYYICLKSLLCKKVF